MITDLRNGNCLAIQKDDRFLEVTISCLGSTRCDVKDVDDKEHKVPYNEIYPIKITKRWLKDNELTCVDENEEEGSNYVHRFLPITYSHSDHRLFVYGHIFPVKIKYVHHFQNALIDCGIEFIPVIKDSHYTQVEGIPAVSFLGGLKQGNDFFDTNAAFGLSSMPKFQMASSGGMARSSRRPGGIVDNGAYQHSFVTIDRIEDDYIREITRYLYDHVSLDGTGRSVTIYLESQGDGRYRIRRTRINYDPRYISDIPWEKIVEFARDFNRYITGDYDLGIVLLDRPIREDDDENIKKGVLLAEFLNDFNSSHAPNRRVYVYNQISPDRLSIKNPRTGVEIPSVRVDDMFTLERNYGATYVAFRGVSLEEYSSIAKKLEEPETLYGGGTYTKVKVKSNYGRMPEAAPMPQEPEPFNAGDLFGLGDANIGVAVEGEEEFAVEEEAPGANHEEQIPEAVEEAQAPREFIQEANVGIREEELQPVAVNRVVANTKKKGKKKKKSSIF